MTDPSGPEDRGVALILAAGDGIGAALAHRFAAGGYHVVAVRRTQDRLDQLAADIEAEGGACTGLVADVRDEDQVVTLFDQVEAELGQGSSRGGRGPTQDDAARRAALVRHQPRWGRRRPADSVRASRPLRPCVHASDLCALGR